jgi:hypothetical protein
MRILLVRPPVPPHTIGRLGPFMRAFVLGANVHYRGHIQDRITPGIV